MNSTVLWVVAGVIVLGGIVYWMFGMQAPANPATGTLQGTVLPPPNDPVPSGAAAPAGANETVTVLYDANGFSPATITVKKGSSVTWTNNGGGNMWVGVDEHPTHTNYSGTSRTEHCAGGADTGTSFDQCANGLTYSFKFDKVGTWDYHNHSNASHTGRVVVVE